MHHTQDLSFFYVGRHILQVYPKNTPRARFAHVRPKNVHSAQKFGTVYMPREGPTPLESILSIQLPNYAIFKLNTL